MISRPELMSHPCNQQLAAYSLKRENLYPSRYD